MESIQILFPIFPLVFLTYFQAYLNRNTVIQAIKDKEMDPRWMKYMFPWKEVPKKVQSSREHYKNLHQAPLFFYLYCILAFVTNHVTQFTVIMAWKLCLQITNRCPIDRTIFSDRSVRTPTRFNAANPFWRQHPSPR